MSTKSNVREKHFLVGLSVATSAVVTISDEVLGVILHNRIAVAMNDGAHLFERFPKFAQAFLASLGALGEDGFDFDTTLERGGERIEDPKVVAPEQG